MQGNRGETTRMGDRNSGIYAQVETWNGKVRVDLKANGDFTVSVGEKYSGGRVALKGNVGDDDVLGRYVVGPDGKVYTEQSEDFITRFRPVRMTERVRRHAHTHAF